MSAKKIFRKQTHVSAKTKRFVQTQKKPEGAKSEVKKCPKDNKSLVIAREIKFAKLLAGNEKKVRDKVLKNLRKWLTIRSESTFAFVEHDFMRLWKGLYYCMWMSDKPLIQEELAESLSKLVHCFNDRETALLYTRCSLKTLAIEWFGIDQYRLDKFQMLIRRIIRQTFEVCKKRSWDREWVEGFAKIIGSILLESKITIGFGLHVTELYLEELAKVSGGDIPEDIVVELVRPFAIQLAGMDDERQIRHVMKHIFRYLLFQSDVGLDYMEKFEAWKHAGFPGGTIDSIEKVEVDDDDEDESEEDEEEQKKEDENEAHKIHEKPLDPRAGRVDVELPQIPFDPKAMAELLTTYRFHPSSTTKTRRQLVRIIKEFNELAEGKMPLGVKEVRVREGTKAETNPKSAALRLLQFEQELYSDTANYKRKKSTEQTIEPGLDSEQELIMPTKKTKLGISKKVNGMKKVRRNNIEENCCKPETTKTLNGPKKVKRNSSEDDCCKLNISKTVNGEKKYKQHSSDGNFKLETSKIVNGTKKVKRNNSEGNCKVEIPKTLNVTKKIKRNSSEGDSCQPNIPKVVNGTRKAKRNSSEGNWCVSENVSPLSPSRQNLSKSVSSIVDKSNSVNQSEPIEISSWLTPVRTKGVTKKMEIEISKTMSVVTPTSQIVTEGSSSSVKKKVKIVLQRNTAQHTSEYMRQLRQSPAIPYDANRKPPVGVLKPSPIPSPVNPFYRRSLK